MKISASIQTLQVVNKIEELESIFNKLKDTLNSLWIRIESIVKIENSETTNREEKAKYVSLDFIREE